MLKALVVSPHSVDLHRINQLLHMAQGAATSVSVPGIDAALERLCDERFDCVLYVGESAAAVKSIRYWMATVLGDEAPPLAVIDPWRLANLVLPGVPRDFCRDVCGVMASCKEHRDVRVRAADSAQDE